MNPDNDDQFYYYEEKNNPQIWDLTGNLKLLTPHLNSSSFEEDYYQVMGILIP